MRIVLDVDDVLADTFSELEDRLGPASDASAENLETMFPGADLEQYLQSFEFHLEIPPIDGAAEGARWIVRRGSEIIYVTSRSPALKVPTQDWLNDWDFPQAPLHCLGREAKKVLLRSDPYDLLIDDQLRYLSVARDRGKRTIALANPWNASWDGLRLRDWKQIIRTI